MVKRPTPIYACTQLINNVGLNNGGHGVKQRGGGGLYSLAKMFYDTEMQSYVTGDDSQRTIVPLLSGVCWWPAKPFVSSSTLSRGRTFSVACNFFLLNTP